MSHLTPIRNPITGKMTHPLGCPAVMGEEAECRCGLRDGTAAPPPAPPTPGEGTETLADKAVDFLTVGIADKDVATGENIIEATQQWRSTALSALASIRDELASARSESQRLREAFMETIKGQRESYERTRPLCSGHVDKMAGRGCLGCLLGQAESAAQREKERAEEAMARNSDLRADLTREKDRADRAEALLSTLRAAPWPLPLNPERMSEP